MAPVGAEAAGPAARDLNLDQIIRAVAGDREERDFIAAVLSGRLRDADAVRERQRVFQDLEDLAVLGVTASVSGAAGST